MQEKINIKSFLLKFRYELLALLVLLIYLSPNIFFPDKARYLVHDNLNSNVVWYKNLAESGKMFAGNYEIVPNSLGGIPRGCYLSEFNVSVLLFQVLNPLQAYNLNAILMHLLAFLSMYIFSRSYLLKTQDKGYSIVLALTFSLLPFWPWGGSGITAQPLLLYAFLNIYNGNKKLWNWIIIILVPFYSVLLFTNLFFIPLLFIALIIHSLCHRKSFGVYTILAFVLFIVVSIITEYRMFMMQFIDHFESQRSNIQETNNLNIKGVIGVSFTLFLKGQYHFYTGVFPIGLLFVLFSIIFSKPRHKRILIGLLILMALLAVVFVLPNWNYLDLNKGKGLLSSITFRFYSLQPLLWFSLIALSIRFLLNKGKRFNYSIIIFFVLFNVSLMFNFFPKDYNNCEFIENTFYNTYISNTSNEHSTFNQYYLVDLFKKVKKVLPTGQFKVACLGISPEVVQYNNYHTIDGYFVYYPKSYSSIMGKISELEMKKLGISSIERNCKIYSYDLQNNIIPIRRLELDYDVMKNLQTRYIFSTVPIIEHSNLKYFDVIVDNNLKLFIYKIV